MPISEICDRHGLEPTLFYQWQKKLFEEGALVFEPAEGRPKRQKDVQARKIEVLEVKVKKKNEVLAELMGEHVALRKTPHSS